MLQESIATNLCTVMADSMDQAKFKCPRLRDLKSKLLSTLFRPRLHCGGTWCHGRSLALAISDECMPKDSVIQIEQVARVLNAIYQDFNTPPLGFSYHADNTYRESNNRHFLAFIILLVALRIFRWGMASFLRVGHRCLSTNMEQDFKISRVFDFLWMKFRRRLLLVLQAPPNGPRP